MKLLLLLAAAASFIESYAAPINVDELMKKGETLLSNTEKTLTDYRREQKGHLIEMAQFELTLYQGFVRILEDFQALKHKNPNDPEIALKYSPTQLAGIENQMNYYESRISEELSYVRTVLAGTNLPKETIGSLIVHAETLIQKAESVLVTRHFDNTDGIERSVVSDLYYEAHSLKNWIEAVKLRPMGVDLRKEIEIFERSQLSISRLLERASKFP